MQFNVFPITELAWPFSHESKPCFYIQDGTYKRQENVDPYPCYAHPEDMVRSITDRLVDVIPMDGHTDIYLPAWETPERVNGWASPQNWYCNENEGKFGAYIVLSGKRIPLHPAMTRYLVSHEYGHVVQFWLEKRFKTKNLVAAYMKDLRQYQPSLSYYGGRTWHATSGEIFANDFRILAAGQEAEFWPHQSVVPHPSGCGPVKAFWMLARIAPEKALDMLPSLERKTDEK